MNISFFNLRFDLFSIIAKEINQIRNNVVRVVACLASVLLYTHYGPLQCFSTYFRKLKEIGVLRPIFPDYVISCDYVLIYHYFTKQIDFRLQTSSIYKNNKNMQEKVARRCSTTKLFLKLHKIRRKMPLLESLSNTIKGLQAIRLATLLKRNPRTSVLEPAVRKCSLK